MSLAVKAIPNILQVEMVVVGKLRVWGSAGCGEGQGAGRRRVHSDPLSASIISHKVGCRRRSYRKTCWM